MHREVGIVRSTRRARLLATLAVASAVLAAACQAGVWAGPATGAKVSVIGDSLVHHAEGNHDGGPLRRLLADELVAAGYQSHVSGYVGKTVEGGYHDLWSLVAHEPELDTLVIALGTNDLHNGIPLEDSRAALRRWLDETGGLRCVALVGINVHATAWNFDVLAPPFNAMLAEEAARRDNVIVADWDPAEDIRPADGTAHMDTEAGYAQYRATIHDAVDRCALRPAPTTTTTTNEVPTP